MKKILLAILALPLMVAFSACSDDDDKPQVNLDLTYENATVVNGEVYVVQPDTFYVSAVSVTPVREGHKATNGPVSYFINGIPLGTNPVAPYGMYLATDSMKVGSYSLQLFMPVYEVGCELSNIAANVQLNIVADSADIPSAAVPVSAQRVSHTFE